MDTDELWGAVLDVLRELAPVEVRRSRFAPKPAIWLDGREIAHWDGPGAIDLRITAKGWAAVRAEFAGDAAITRNPGRRDWIEVHGEAADVERLRPVFAALVANN